MRWINAILNPIAELCFAPFAQLPPWAALTFWSLVAAVLMMLVFKYTSRQQKLREMSDRTWSALLGMVLFKDELRTMFACQGRLLAATAGRLWYSIWPPLVVMIVPFVLVTAQLGMRYQFRPLRPGESALVTLHLRDGAWESGSRAALEVPAGVTIETPPLRVAADKSVTWRVRPDEHGAFELAWNIDGQRYVKRLEARAGLTTASPRRPTGGWWDQLLYPIEAPYDAGAAVAAIDVSLPERSTPILGLDVHWIISFVVLSMVFALLVKPIIKVQL